MISDFNFPCVIETWYKTCVLWVYVVHQAKQTKNSDKFSKQVFSIFAAYNLKRGELLSLNKQNICTQNTLGFQLNNTVYVYLYVYVG